MSDFTKATPRQGVHSYVTIPVTLPSIEPASSTTPSGEKEQVADDDTKTKHVKYSSKAIRFSNNSISSFDGFATTLHAILQSTETLEWLDLSFNDLTKISEAILELSNLKVLYLHANVIDDMKQVDKLAGLPNLKTLTLHGNIIDGAKGYRQYVVTEIPQLQYFDFSRITKADRDKAVTWRQLKIIGPHKKKKKAEKKD
uniref:Leucine-rich repeat-containing protein 51 n=1 Tax=Phallusia mammillata TaxID=59560 RepID=A0A6F9DK25_9ASCI|nr:leucine-rich repeat-containing protein 51 [Phallusia mammillata]